LLSKLDNDPPVRVTIKSLTNLRLLPPTTLLRVNDRQRELFASAGPPDAETRRCAIDERQDEVVEEPRAQAHIITQLQHRAALEIAALGMAALGDKHLCSWGLHGDMRRQLALGRLNAAGAFAHGIKPMDSAFGHVQRFELSGTAKKGGKSSTSRGF
jgi:hypothetical protein